MNPKQNGGTTPVTDKNLEEVIRDLAARGEITHLSVVPSQNGKLWRASFAMCSKYGVSFAEDVDPVKALVLACTTAKMKARRAEKRPEVIEHVAVVDEDIEALM
jgi:hypothetical protein